MVAPEPGEPLLLYIVATTEAMSMVLVAERPKPHQHQKPKGTSAASFKSLDLGSTGGVGVEEANGSQIPEAPLFPVTQIGSHVATGSQLLGHL
jgi:hypothetical protein